MRKGEKLAKPSTVLKKEPTVKTKTSLEDLQAIKEKRAREVEKAYEEISLICQKYKCGLDAEVLISKNNIDTKVRLVDLLM